MTETSLFGIFLLCLTIQLFYYLFYFSRLAFARTRSQSTPEFQQGVSIVVCAKNELQNLQRLLPALYNQLFPSFEIIVVNDRSTDETQAFLLEQKKVWQQLKVINIDHTPPHINGKKYALSLGIKQAGFDTLLLTDADCIPATPNWISVMTAKFNISSTKIALGYCQYTAYPGLLNLFIRFETLYTAVQYLSLALAGSPYMGVGRNLAYSKSFFMERRGFSDYLKVTGGDDDLFVNKNADKRNTVAVYDSGGTMYSEPKKSWKAYFRQKKRHLSVGKYYKLSDRIRMGLLFLSQLFFWVLFIVLLLFWQEPYYVIGGFVLRMAVQYLIFYKASVKLEGEFKLWALPLLDVLYVMYYIATGISALASRNIKWN